MTKKPWCCICGKTKKESDELMAAVARSDKFWEERQKWRRDQEDKRIANGVPVGDCGSCREKNVTCDFSCVGV